MKTHCCAVKFVELNFEAGCVVIAWTLLAHSMKMSLDTWAMHIVSA